MGWWSKIKKGVKKATKAVTKAVSDTGKFCQKNAGIISAIGAVAGTVLTGGLAGPLVGAALGGIGKVTDAAKKVTATAAGINSSLGAITSAIPSGSSKANNNGDTGTGTSSAVANGVNLSRGSNGVSNAPMTVETKKKITLGGAAVAALSLLKFMK